MMSGSADDTVKVYDVRKRTELGTLTQHTSAVNCVALYGRKYALSGGDDGTLCVWRCKGENPGNQLTMP